MSSDRCASLGDVNVFAEVHILYRIDDVDAFFQRLLEGLPAQDQAHATGALVDDSRLDGVLQVIAARGATRIDEADAAHVTVGDLIATEVDRVIGGQLVIHTRMGFAKTDVGKAAVGDRELLFDNVRLDGSPDVVGLASEVSGSVVVLAVFLETAVAGIAP